MRIFIMRAAKEVMSNCGEEKGRDEGSLVLLHIALARIARSSKCYHQPFADLRCRAAYQRCRIRIHTESRRRGRLSVKFRLIGCTM